jgi:hypothetical protein
MLLVGGGLIPPVIGVAAGVVGARIRRGGGAREAIDLGQKSIADDKTFYATFFFVIV